MSPCSESQVNAIESNDEGGDALYQDQKVNYYLREKKIYIDQNRIVEMIQAIISYFEKRYGNMKSSETETEANVNSDHGNTILFDMCSITTQGNSAAKKGSQSTELGINTN